MNGGYKRVKDLRQQVENSKGWKIKKKNELLGITYHVFMANNREIKQSLEIFSNQGFARKIWAVENREDLRRYHIDVIRLLHNYLAAAKTLIDHTRIFIRNLEWDTQLDTQFKEEYNEKVKKEFETSGISKFLQELRNYILHKGIPTTVANLRFNDKEELDCSIELDINQISAWDKWTSISRKYINTLDSQTKLIDIVNEYTQKVLGFYKWLGERQDQLYKDQIKELHVLQEKLERALTDAGYKHHLRRNQ